jgi:C-terminal processing protease CtpA/Prc
MNMRWADIAVIWTVMQHFYPYFDVVKTDWDRALTEALTEAAGAKDRSEFADVLRRLIVQLHDGHGNVYGADAPRYAAPWVTLTSGGDESVVLNAQGNAKNELQRGDVILAIDGRRTDEVVVEAGSLISSATPQWRRWVALQDLLAGSALQPITLEVRSPDGKRRNVTLKREVSRGGGEARPPSITELEPGIWYVDLERASDYYLDSAIPKLAQAKGIVFDMRGYPTGHAIEIIQHLIDKPVTSAQWHIPIVTSPDRKGMAFERSNWTLEPKAPRFKAKVAFLTDGRAISYAETYMGIVEHYKLGEIVGEPTAGTNGNVNPFRTPDGYTVFWTGMKVLKHDGSQHHGVGILPTVPVSRTLKGIIEGRDEQLERAIQVVKGKT